MKKSYLLFFFMLSMACNSTGINDNSTVDSVSVDRSPSIDSSLTPTEDERIAPEVTLLKINQAVLECLKNKDYTTLEGFIHPKMGLQFSPYALVNPQEDIVIPKSDFSAAVKSTQTMLWGQYDGTGDPIELSMKDYLEKFVYDVDFLNAEEVNINASSSSGNIMNNIGTAYAGADYVENYFAGFNPEFQGMDWRALRLVFKKEGDSYFLIGIVHDQWTT